jgi:type VI protein secretion system component Hcp
LERRVMLAASFPPPALAGTYDGGWDLATESKAGSVASTLDGKTYPPGAFANYSLEIDGQQGVIPLLSVSYGDSAPGVGDPAVSELSLTAPHGKYSTGMLEAVGLRRKAGPMTVHEKDAQGREHRLWILEDATLTNFSVGGSTGGSTPVTSFSLDFKKITLETIDYTSGGMALPPRMVSFTTSGTGYTGTGTDFGGVTFAAGSEPAQLLDLGTGQVAIV